MVDADDSGKDPKAPIPGWLGILGLFGIGMAGLFANLPHVARRNPFGCRYQGMDNTYEHGTFRRHWRTEHRLGFVDRRHRRS